MARCHLCGRRVTAPHEPCGAVTAAAVVEAPAGPLPHVAGFRVEGVLGRGGFSTVFAAVRLADGARAALKVAPAGLAREHLVREEEALRAIGPPAVPGVLGVGTLADGSPFLALELVAAPTLAAQLEAGAGLLPPARLAPLALGVLDAVSAIHAAGFAHGDLSPENVLIQGEPPSARLLDLGLAERLGAGPSATAPTAFAGTPEYMSPEQCQGRRPDARSDVYALGALLFELGTGRPPFFGQPAGVRHAHVNLRPPGLCGFPDAAPALAKVIERCLAKDPDERWASAAELRAAFTAALSAAPPAATAAERPSSVAAAAAGGARRRVGVVYLETSAEPASLHATAEAAGGVAAHTEGRRVALVFDPAGADNPALLALRAARAVVARGLAPRALVDLASASVRPRPGGGNRYLCAEFARRASWPRPDDPAGLLATGRAALVLAGITLDPVPGRAGLFTCPPRTAGAEEPTVIRQSAASLWGREELVDRLAAMARTALRDARPAVASVLGGAGMGKSHLGAVLADQLRALPSAPAVIELRATPAAEDGGNLAALLLRLLDLPAGAGAPPDGGRSVLRPALPPAFAEGAWAAAALALGWLPATSPEIRAIGAAPGALVSLATRATSALLRSRAGDRPICVVLDDAHLAEGATLDALESAALAEGGAPLFVCALARPSFAGSRPYWGERAASRAAEPLGPLAPAAAAALCRQLLLPADSVPARAVERLVERTQGVPLLLVELVRGLERDGLVHRHPESGAHYLATDELDRFPDLPLVEWLADAELRAMPSDLAAHARLAALLGEQVGADEGEGVLAELVRAGMGASFPLDARAATRRLLGLGLLVQHRDGRLGYRLPLVREAVARSTPDAQRRAIAEAAFRFYARPGPLPELLRLTRLAHHAVETGRRAEAASVLLRVAVSHAHRHAYVDAEGMFSAALDNLPPRRTEDRLAALRGRGLMRSRIGRHPDAVADLAAAAVLARELADRSAEMECLLDEATALDWMSDFEGSRARVEAAAAVALAPGPRLTARLDLGRGRALFRGSRWADACVAFRSAAVLAEQHGDEGYETLIAALLLLGCALPPLGRIAEAEEALERARRLASERGDLVHVGIAYMNRRNLRVARGDLDGALRDQLESVLIARELGHLDSEYYSEYNMAELLYQAGDLERASPHLARAEEIERAHPEATPGPLGALLRARALTFAGDLTSARRLLEAFRSVVDRPPALGGRSGVLGPSEAVLADMVELATGEATEAEWDALQDRSARDSVEQEPVEVLEMRGLAALRAGRAAEGRAALTRALELTGRIPGLLARRIRAALEAAGSPD